MVSKYSFFVFASCILQQNYVYANWIDQLIIKNGIKQETTYCIYVWLFCFSMAVSPAIETYLTNSTLKKFEEAVQHREG